MQRGVFLPQQMPPHDLPIDLELFQDDALAAEFEMQFVVVPMRAETGFKLKLLAQRWEPTPTDRRLLCPDEERSLADKFMAFSHSSVAALAVSGRAAR